MENNGSVSACTITWEDIEKAQLEVMKEGFLARYKTNSKFIKEYAGYVSRLQQEEKENRDEYVKSVATMLFPDEQAYNVKMARYRKWYGLKKNLFKSIEKLYSLFYELSKEENLIPENEIDSAIKAAIAAEKVNYGINN